MKRKKLTNEEKSNRATAQRISFVLVLCNVLDSPKGVSDNIKNAIASSLINTMEDLFIPEDDESLANLINNSIDGFCEYMEEKTGVENYREVLMEKIKDARKMLEVVKSKIEREKRIEEGNDILSKICLN